MFDSPTNAKQKMKTCPKCKQEKLATDFHKYKYSKDGLRRICKECKKEENRKYKAKNKERIRAYNKRYNSMTPAEKEKAREKKKEYSTKRSDSFRKDYSRKYYQAHKDTFSLSYKKWCKNNPEKLRQYYKKATAKKYSKPKTKLGMIISRSIYDSLKNKFTHQSSKRGRHWETLVGYTIDQLKTHLEKQFQDGMTWENYGQWHIDHKIPKAVFNFQSPENIDFKRCWALKNLQPLWARENISKGTKLEKPFQPALLI